MLLRDQGLKIYTASRAFTPATAKAPGAPVGAGPADPTSGSAAAPWYSSEARGSLIHATDDPSAGVPATPNWRRTVDIVSRGPRAPMSIFLIDIVPTGSPLWLDEFSAEDAGDVVRTYGLGRLFENFRADALRTIQGPGLPPNLGRIFIVAS
jgi:hypothetical protein